MSRESKKSTHIYEVTITIVSGDDFQFDNLVDDLFDWLVVAVPEGVGFCGTHSAQYSDNRDTR